MEEGRNLPAQRGCVQGQLLSAGPPSGVKNSCLERPKERVSARLTISIRRQTEDKHSTDAVSEEATVF